MTIFNSNKDRPLFEERIWGNYQVLDISYFNNNNNSLTKKLIINSGRNISYQRHFKREEIWTIIGGEGLLVLDGEIKIVKRGDIIFIPCKALHSIKAISTLTIIEVQNGSELVEEDIERLDFDWENIKV